jgi:hypothetical protein
MQSRIARLVAAIVVAAAGAGAFAGPCDVKPETRRVYVRDFQARADGKTDDGAAIRAAVKEATKDRQPAALIFETAKTYRVTTFDEKYAMRIRGANAVQVIGNGAMLLLEPPNRALEVAESTDVSICNFVLDYFPLPFTQGTIVGSNTASQTFDVDIENGYDVPSSKGAEAEFGSKGREFAVPFAGPGDFYKRVLIRSITPLANTRRVRVEVSGPGQFRALQPVGTRIVLPQPGKGQTGNFTFQILRNNRVNVEDITVLAAPQGTFYVADNVTEINFRRIVQKTPANSSRVMTGWRGIFHAKDNRAAVRWEDCALSGAFDDAINLNSMYQLVLASSGGDKWVIRDLGRDAPTEFRKNDRIKAVNLDPQRQEIGDAVVTSVEKASNGDQIIGVSPRLSLKPAPESCAEPRATCGSRIVNLSTANPGSSIERSRIVGSVRLRGSASINNSEIDGVLQITSSPTREGPSPENIVVSKSKLFGTIRIGADLNPGTTRQDWVTGERWAKNIVFRENYIGAIFKADGASLKLIDNELAWPAGRQFLLNNTAVEIRNLRSAGARIADPSKRISIGTNMAPSDVVLTN